MLPGIVNVARISGTFCPKSERITEFTDRTGDIYITCIHPARAGIIGSPERIQRHFAILINGIGVIVVAQSLKYLHAVPLPA